MSENSVPRTCRTVLLGDEPTIDDQFGSHTRVAKAIVDLVACEAGGHSIGLLGAWGSGKSSVVRIAERESANKIRFFLFDAWAHQGDPLRRIFLEKLIDFFGESSLLKEREKWTAKKEQLASRLEERTTESQELLTGAGIVIAIALLVLALSFNTFSVEKLLSKGLTYQISVWALVTMIGAAVVIAITIVVSRNRKRTILGLINKTSEIRSKTSKTADPTSIEFQHEFAELLDECIQGPDAQPFVIAVDNLDRVSSGDAEDLWSTLRAFLELRSFEKHLWAKKAWLLVTFDPSILRTWSGTTSPQVSGAPDEVFVASYPHPYSSTTEESFLEKTFQVIFDVPTPVLSDSEGFLLRNLSTAFPDHDPQDLENVLRLIRAPKFAQQAPSTPRQMKLFINRLGSLHRQWADDVPLLMQTLYILLERVTPNIPFVLQDSNDGNALGMVPPGLIPSDWREWIAGLHFNLSKDRVLHTLLTPRLSGALEAGDSELVESLSKIHGSIKVLEEIVVYRARGWPPQQSSLIALAARSIKSLPATDSSILNARRALCGATMMVQFWRTLDSRVGEGILQLLAWDGSKELWQHVVKTLGMPPGVVEDAALGEWSSALLTILQYVGNEHPEVLRTFRLQTGNQPLYAKLVAALAENAVSSEIPSIWEPSDVPQAVGAFGTAAQSGEFKEAHLAALKYLSNRYQNFAGFVNLADTLVSQPLHQVAENFDKQIARPALLGFCLISLHNQAARQRLRELVDMGTLNQVFSLAAEKRSIKLASACVVTTLISASYQPITGFQTALARLFGSPDQSDEALISVVVEDVRFLECEAEVRGASRKIQSPFLELLQQKLEQAAVIRG